LHADAGSANRDRNERSERNGCRNNDIGPDEYIDAGGAEYDANYSGTYGKPNATCGCFVNTSRIADGGLNVEAV
jgi:hypothetical protein